ncbi:hypothetical protein [Actinacidiphila acididurans]|uniref:Uncharacterized protein n=1 Tax=Actinacidiphila acididurans TaxID=2784346 RepID=A0ABS2U340_9ACTN|nr:hypothetical protein [Actinacidiphila acididurans]MBM9510017.1 hypothetical protein [Actinacidiphila acididurans]
MPLPTKHAALLALLPDVAEVPDVLTQAGRPDLAGPIGKVIAYAEEQAKRNARQNEVRHGRTPAQALRVSLAFAEHVRAHALEDVEGDEDKAGKRISAIVRDSLADFVAGDWTPPAPQRVRRGTGTTKTTIAVRVPADLWQQAGDLGKDEGQIAARGFRITAERVAILALEQTYGLPAEEQSSTTA